MDPVKRKLFLSLILGAAAALAAWFYLEARESDLLRRGKAVKVIVARKHVPSFTRLENSQLAYKEVPAEYVAKGTVTEAEEALGMLTLVPFNAGEPLFHNKIAKGAQNLSSAVPEGMRAFSVPVDKVTGLNGLLRPGDLVDVLFITESSSRSTTLFQAVKVLAAGELYTDKEGKGDTQGTVTLALSPDDCARALSAIASGALHFALRSPGDLRFAGGPAKSSAAAPESQAEDFILRKK